MHTSAVGLAGATALLACLAPVLAACGPARHPEPQPAAPEAQPAASACESAPAAAKSVLAVEVAEPIEPIRDAVRRAGGGDWGALEGRIAPEVAVVREPGTDTGSMVVMDGAAALAWLRERWQPGVEIRGTHVVEHHPWVEFCMAAWRAVPPSGTILSLRAHLQRASEGPARWLVDVVLYE